ncbi:MAG TPA: tetratricopeptide repeat protein [Anaeromyxobacter sp.]|nr:tetratricopeptide repeat protein [Anaeromyxobacter sp.]
MRALLFALVATPLAVARGGDRAVSRPHVDPEAMREVRGDLPGASARAIAHYLEGRRCQDEADLRCATAELDLAVTYDERSPDLHAAFAEVLALGGQLERAEVEARRAIELAGGAGPAATRGHLLLGQLLSGSEPEAAVLELREAVRGEVARAAVGEPPDPDPWRLLSVQYLDMGDEPAAERTLEDLEARAPGQGAAFREVGRWYLDRHRPGAAEGHLRRAVAAARSDLQAWRLLARVHAELGRSLEVRSDLESILELAPEDPEALFGLGTAALEEDDLTEAHDLLGRYQRSSPDRPGAAARAAEEWLAFGRAEEALACARGALEEAAADARLRLVEGLALVRLRRFAEAATALRQVGGDDGDTWIRARVALAEALSRSGHLVEAGRALEAPLRHEPGDVRLAMAQAAVLERSGRVAEAAAALEQAALLRPGGAEPEEAAALRAARSDLLCRAGRPREALSDLEQALSAQPRSTSLRLALASALMAAGAPERAAAELRALLALEPGQPQAQARLARFLADEAPIGERDIDEAERLADRAVVERPRSPEALEALGRVRSLRGDHEGAVAALERAALLSGGEARYLDDLGEAYRAAGRRRDAAAAWRRALASAADEPPAVAARVRAALQRKLRAPASSRGARSAIITPESSAEGGEAGDKGRRAPR